MIYVEDSLVSFSLGICKLFYAKDIIEIVLALSNLASVLITSLCKRDVEIIYSELYSRL